MRLECKNAQVTLYWDGYKMMELIIKNQRGDILRQIINQLVFL